MNRFFSKLDLRDIKIDPTGTRFPPDAEEYEADSDEEQFAASSPIVEAEPEVEEDVAIAANWAPVQASVEDHTNHVAHQDDEDDYESPDPVNVNGNISQEVEARGGEILKVSARSRPSAVAGAIAGVVRESGRAEVQAIGAGATNQAVKAVAIARDYLRETGIEAVCLPAFIDVTIDNEDRTAIRLVVEPR